MEYFFICSNLALWIYVCGRTILDGCGVQIAERGVVRERDNGELAIAILLRLYTKFI